MSAYRLVATLLVAPALAFAAPQGDAGAPKTGTAAAAPAPTSTTPKTGTAAPTPAAPKTGTAATTPAAPKTGTAATTPAAPKTGTAAPTPAAPKTGTAAPTPAAPKTGTAAPTPAAPKTGTAAAPAPAAAAPAEAPAAPSQDTSSQKSAADADEIRREVDQRVEAAKKELREEIRAQAATQSVAQSWQEEWVEEKRKLELFTIDGYYRVRPELFHKFNLNRGPDPGGFTLFPTSPVSPREVTAAGVNMRLRMDPTLNISEEVRLRMQIDVLDNVLMGTTPDYAFSRSDTANFFIFSQNQVPNVSGQNAIRDTIQVRRVYGEVTTPVGVVRFGRMGSQWGLGMVHNDGNCLDCDYGDTVDRLQFVTQPLPGYFVTPMIDFNVEGPSSAQFGQGGQPTDLTQSDDAHSYVLAVARRDTDQQIKAKLENNQAVINYGAHITYRTQRSDPVTFFMAPFNNEGGNTTNFGYNFRDAWLVTPDLWFKYEQKLFRVEVEAASRIGSIGSIGGVPGTGAVSGDPRGLSILEFAAVAQAEFRPMARLKVGAEIGYASGDPANGMGLSPSRTGSGPDGFTAPGDIDGPQFNCPPTGGCTDKDINNFMFNRDYRVDLILWRELYRGITDALYVKPSIEYEVAEGLTIFGSAIYSRTIYNKSTPSSGRVGLSPGPDANLGTEFDAGARYETEDGFFASMRAGILFPFGGFNNLDVPGSNPLGPAPLESATAFRATLGVKF